MNAGIIAAGWGSRLGGGPKALQQVAGRALIDHVLDGLVSAGADCVTCIVNDASRDVPAHVAAAGCPVPIDWIVQTTPSSMHSFLVVLERLAQSGEAWNLITTVDAICTPGSVGTFAQRAAAIPGADLVLGLTDVIDDEKPLYAAVEHLAHPERDNGLPVECPKTFRIRALDADAAGSEYVTAGVYVVTPALLQEKATALSSGFGALRQFLGHVLARGYRVYGVPLPPVVDVDRLVDVEAAERLLGASRRQDDTATTAPSAERAS